MAVNLNIGKNSYGLPVASFHKGDVYMVVWPNTGIKDNKTITDWEVHLYEYKNGEADLSKPLNQCRVDGGPDDLEEIADTFASRLDSGINPNDLFQDVREANAAMIGNNLEGLKSEKR